MVEFKVYASNEVNMYPGEKKIESANETPISMD